MPIQVSLIVIERRSGEKVAEGFCMYVCVWGWSSNVGEQGFYNSNAYSVRARRRQRVVTESPEAREERLEQERACRRGSERIARS